MNPATEVAQPKTRVNVVRFSPKSRDIQFFDFSYPQLHGNPDCQTSQAFAKHIVATDSERFAVPAIFLRLTGPRKLTNNFTSYHPPTSFHFDF